jgi:phosphoribosylformylglycinamidine cyclo-ligase
MVEETRQAHRRGDRYAEAGVDIAAGNALVERLKPLAAATRRPGADGRLGGFGALFDLAACGYRDPLLVATADGVGTKLSLARRAGRLVAIGTDLVAMCVNDLVVQGAEPLFFLDYYATGRLDVGEAAEVVAGIAAACRASGCALIGGETAEMPGIYAPGDFDLAGFAVGAVERDSVLPRPDIGPGDIVLGLASSGLHSNGFSLVRLLLEEQGLGPADEAPFAPGRSLGDVLLAPTRLYVAAALDAARGEPTVKAMAHITGGGLVENLPRVLPPGTVARLDACAWPLPPVFRWLKRVGRLHDRELARTLNVGIGLALVVAADASDAARRRLEARGEQVLTIGRIEPGHGPARVQLDGTERAWADDAPPS